MKKKILGGALALMLAIGGASIAAYADEFMETNRCGECNSKNVEITIGNEGTGDYYIYECNDCGHEDGGWI